MLGNTALKLQDGKMKLNNAECVLTASEVHFMFINVFRIVFL